ncbi:MAG: sigma-70 family RNA polymerase sigma factor [Planctomycetaceae bacterium]|nr:sigma-70 family RNA polymerase sigma factor [Planctomycetaceae bacterium]
MLRTLSDQSLLQRLRTGSEDAATELYGRYAKRLDCIASRGLGSDMRSVVGSEDVVQSIFRTFFRRAAAGDYDVPEGSELWNLLVTISLNKIRAIGLHYRRQKRSVARTKHGDSATDDMAVGDDVACQVLRMVIDELIESLPESHQRIIHLHIDNWGVSEIASKTQRSKRTVERVLQQFRTQLKELICDDVNDKSELHEDA